MISLNEVGRLLWMPPCWDHMTMVMLSANYLLVTFRQQDTPANNNNNNMLALAANKKS